MKIETKYNIGQEVWLVIKFPRARRWTVVADTILSLYVRVEDDEEEPCIDYCTEDYREGYDERDIFLSEDGAQAECNRRNAEASK